MNPAGDINNDTKTRTSDFIPIFLNSLRLDSILDFDLYIKVEDEHVLFRASSLPFTDATRASLHEHGIAQLYLSAESQRKYLRYVESHIKEIIEDKSVGQEVIAGIIYESAKLMIKDVLKNPCLVKNIERGMEMVESTMMYIVKDEGAFANMLKVMSFDYTIYTHSMNVCTFSLALARFIGIEDREELHSLGIGALLHDVGKTKVDEKILNKRGPLTEHEMDIMRKHPQWGFEIILQTKIIPHNAYHPIIEHHEREDCTGYPHKKGKNDLHSHSKIVAIADVFDAMTTQKVYRNARDSFSTLKEMHKLKHQFDPELLGQFTRMMGPEN